MRLRLDRFLLATALCSLPATFLGGSPAATGQRTATRGSAQPRELLGAYRFERAHWIYVHLQGSPHQIGLQHGYLLAPEIDDTFHDVRLENMHATGRSWQFFRDTGKNIYWPHIEPEYRQELQGIADGVRAHGIRDMDVWDVLALNALFETEDYYVPYLEEKEHGKAPASLKPPGNCSAFVATGDWTRDHRPVIAHSMWTSFPKGERWRILFDIAPQHGHRILMDGLPGKLDSGDDFGMNDAGIEITETTITGFKLFDPNGIPEFIRARKAMQYAGSIDDFERIMVEGNNGGYANDWLVADNHRNEVARLELGLKFHKLWRTRNGYFVGSNFPSDPTFIRTETDFNPNDSSSSPNARHIRWKQLMAQYKGKIDATLAQQFLADHFDTYTGKERPSERTLCGHVDISRRGIPEWGYPPYNPAGAVNAKAADSSMASKMSFLARAGRPCGQGFQAASFLKRHPEFDWEKPALEDMPGNPWASFQSNDHAH